tara:strand:+ start:1313 stop:2152 length:840 start_codon:yes stop_codon:yes gene_type:complete
MKLFIYILLLFYQTQGLIFYYDTNTSNLNTIEYKYKNQNNHNIFVFLPGTSAYCKDYSQLFFTINNHINILCINYKNDLNSSEEYFKNHSFQDKGKLLEKSVYDGLKKIKNITNIDFLDKSNNQPKWNNIIASGHSQGSVIVSAWAKNYDLARLVLFSGPGCQFGKRLHNWIESPFATKNSKIYGIESLQDKILPFYKGNKHFGCKKNDGVLSYLKSMNIDSNNIQIISPVNQTIKKNTQIILLNITIFNSIKSHLFTSFNMKTMFDKFRKQLWLYSIL